VGRLMVRRFRRCSHDVPVPTKVRGSAANYPPQIHVSRGQDLPTHMRVLAITREPLSSRYTTSGAQGPTLRLHRTLPAVGLLLTLGDSTPGTRPPPTI
jgi:hypothetical protein